MSSVTAQKIFDQSFSNGFSYLETEERKKNQLNRNCTLHIHKYCRTNYFGECSFDPEWNKWQELNLF